MSNPRKNVYKKIIDRIELDDKDFDNLAHPIGKKLNKEQRSKVVEALNEYNVETQRFQALEETKQSRKAIAKVAKTLKAAIAALQTLQDQSGIHRVLFWHTGINPEEEMSRLASLETEARKLRKETGQRGRKPNIMIRGLLFKLEMVFVEAGGKTTGVTREAGGTTLGTPRKSPFIDDFVWELLQRIPQDTPKPYAKTALAATWEKHRKHRPVGYELLFLKL
jgi:hypothetical protein